MNDDEFYNTVDHMGDQINSMIGLTANRIKQMLIRNTVLAIDDNKINATGTLRKSIDGKVDEYATFAVITVFSNVFYSIYRYDDCISHMPPIEPIYQWVRTKRLTGTYSAKTKKRLGSKLTQYKQDMAMAWAIAMKIKQKGTLGVKFFEIALQQSWPFIIKEISKLNFQGA